MRHEILTMRRDVFRTRRQMDVHDPAVFILGAAMQSYRACILEGVANARSRSVTTFPSLSIYSLRVIQLQHPRTWGGTCGPRGGGPCTFGVFVVEVLVQGTGGAPSLRSGRLWHFLKSTNQSLIKSVTQSINHSVTQSFNQPGDLPFTPL